MVGKKLTAKTVKAVALIAFACVTLTCATTIAQEAGEITLEKQPGINFLSLLFQGGWFMVPLAVLSIAVVAISVERFIVLRKERLFPTELVTHLGMLAQSPGGLDPREAYMLCQAHPSVHRESFATHWSKWDALIKKLKMRSKNLRSEKQPEWLNWAHG